MAALLLCAACGDQPQADGEAELPERTADAIRSTDTILVEGRPEAVAVAPFTSDEGFPLPFRTYIPDTAMISVETESIDPSEGSAAVEFGWKPATDAPAQLRFVVLDRAFSDNDARGLVRSLGTSFGPIGSGGLEYEESMPPPDHTWATLSYRLRGQVRGTAVDGWISLGYHADRPFYFMAIYPLDYGDGLGPRFDYIMRNWQWLETGELLQPGPTR